MIRNFTPRIRVRKATSQKNFWTVKEKSARALSKEAKALSRKVSLNAGTMNIESSLDIIFDNFF